MTCSQCLFRYGLRYQCLSSISDLLVDYSVPMLSVETRWVGGAHNFVPSCMHLLSISTQLVYMLGMQGDGSHPLFPKELVPLGSTQVYFDSACLGTFPGARLGIYRNTENCTPYNLYVYTYKCTYWITAAFQGEGCGDCWQAPSSIQHSFWYSKELDQPINVSPHSLFLTLATSIHGRACTMYVWCAV